MDLSDLMLLYLGGHCQCFHLHLLLSLSTNRHCLSYLLRGRGAHCLHCLVLPLSLSTNRQCLISCLNFRLRNLSEFMFNNRFLLCHRFIESDVALPA